MQSTTPSSKINACLKNYIDKVMEIILNGKPYQIKQAQNLADIITGAAKDPRHIIAELNGKIIPSGSWTMTVLRENDQVELVSFVGGG